MSPRGCGITDNFITTNQTLIQYKKLGNFQVYSPHCSLKCCWKVTLVFIKRVSPREGHKTLGEPVPCESCAIALCKYSTSKKMCMQLTKPQYHIFLTTMNSPPFCSTSAVSISSSIAFLFPIIFTTRAIKSFFGSQSLRGKKRHIYCLYNL